jgi:hypothetical protein
MRGRQARSDFHFAPPLLGAIFHEFSSLLDKEEEKIAFNEGAFSCRTLILFILREDKFPGGKAN